MDNLYSQSSPAEQPSLRARLRGLSRADLFIGIALVVTMLLGGAFRFVGLNWDDFTHLHPDERFLTDVTQGLGMRLTPSDSSSDNITPDEQVSLCVARYPATGGLGGYFDALCSPWNPHNANSGHGMYVYGTLPVFMTRVVAEVVAPFSEWWGRTISARFDPTLSDYSGGQWRTYDGVHLIWRYLSALAEMAVVLVCFFTGLRLHNRWVGLIAAWLYASVVFSIQLSHFATTDAISSMFTAVAILFAVCVQREGKLRDYVLFGLFFGFALASRINLLPLVGVIVLAAMVRVLPFIGRGALRGEFERQLGSAFAGLVVAGLVTVVVFRLTNPYAFMGPGILGLQPNQRFLQDLATAQSLVSGAIDSPPNFQWAGRTSYIFPWWNMVMWGMGLPLGLMAWGALVWAIYRLFAGKRGALLNILLIAWVVAYFLFMGRNWVMTMRYFIPLYSSLVVLAAWALYTLVIQARAAAERRQQRGVTVRKGLAWGALIGVTAFTTIWALMYTNVYRGLLTRVQAGYWVWESLPGDFAMRVETPDGRGDDLVPMNGGQYSARAVPLINIGMVNRLSADENDLVGKATRFDDSMPSASEMFTVPESGVIRTIQAPHLGDPNDDPEPEVLQIHILDMQGTIVASARIDQNLTRSTHITGDPVEIPLDQPLQVEAGQRYRFEVELVSGGPVISGGTIFTWEGAWDDPVPAKVCTPPLGISLVDDPPAGMIGDGRACNGRDPWFGLVIGFEQNVVYEDDYNKLDSLLRSLDHSDYIGISSNRFYDTLNRNPLRWPLTNTYYDALFNGELGWELVATFQETYQLGPLQISDQYLPTYHNTAFGDMLNEFESEEAFSVYDHPVVFIFRKSADYDPSRVREILGSVPLTRVNDPSPYNMCPEDPDLMFCSAQLVGVATWSTEDAARAPTALQFTSEQRQTQQDGGTWSERFASESPVNTQVAVTIIAWYLAIFAFGAAAFPLLFVLFPRLADRGYGVARISGLFVVSFAAWYLASIRIPLWSQLGVALGLIGLAGLSAAAVWHQRARFVRWLRLHWRRLLAIEALMLAFFLAFVTYRMLNPDLWHDSFGGEKPMDFAYWNGVLRSTVFPPIDPWFSGGYINYYYFGFVIIGSPVLLLKMLPSIAYNLVLPTWFALTAVGAFSVAFSAMHALNHHIRARGGRWLGNKWLAGVAAALLCVVLGNLDTPRVFLSGLAQAAGYTRPSGLQEFLIDEYVREHDGQSPDEGTLASIIDRAGSNSVGDRLRYELYNAGEQITSVMTGLGQLLGGQEVYISPDRWFWGPSRVLAETPGVEGSAITEMPAFTFIYADPHAHMISMPMQFLVLAFLMNELLSAGTDTRRRWARFLALALGAAVVGMLRATNTWDWITYMLLGAAGLAFAWWLRWRTIHRASVINLALRVGGFLVLTFLAVLPFTTWYASEYNSIRPWTDGKTPLWALFDIHGLFLFLIGSLLVWETGRWLRAVHVRTLRGAWLPVVILGAVGLAVLLASVLLSAVAYQVTLVALPMLAWTVALFFRQGQTRAMQYLLALTGLSLGIILGVEYIVLDGDIGRQNTIFKFYIQVWLMLSAVGGVALAVLWRASERWRAWLRIPWTVALVVLVAIASLFPIMAARGKLAFRMQPATAADGSRLEPPMGTLDGMLFMTWAQRWEGDSNVLAADPTRSPFALAEDYQMIRWLQENVQGSPTIIEGLGDDTQYRWNGRVAIYTGLPAVIGWNFHQRQQRTFDPFGRIVEFRNSNVNAFYETADIDTAWTMLTHYGVEYVIVGRYERANTNDAGLAKFPEMAALGLLNPVFTTGESTIYQVNHDAAFDPQTRDVG